MTDIVERLREFGHNEDDRALHAEAATEIETLRARVQMFEAKYGAVHD